MSEREPEGKVARLQIVEIWIMKYDLYGKENLKMSMRLNEIVRENVK